MHKENMQTQNKKNGNSQTVWGLNVNYFLKDFNI